MRINFPWTFVAAALIVSGQAWTEISTGPWPELAAPLRDWSAVAHSMPAHPQSRLALDALLNAIPGDADFNTRLISLAVGYPDLPLGLFALETYWSMRQDAGVVEQIWKQYPDTRLAALAFDLFVEATADIEGACAQALLLGETRVAQHARVRLASRVADQADWMTALALQLHAFSNAMEGDIPRAARLFPDLSHYFDHADLPHLQPDWAALMVQDAAAEHHAALRLKEGIRLSQDEATPMHALRMRTGNPAALRALADDENVDTESRARAALLLASHPDEDVDTESLMNARADFLASVTQIQDEPETAANLLLYFLDREDVLQHEAMDPVQAESQDRAAATFLLDLIHRLDGDGGRGIAGRAASLYEKQGRFELEALALERTIALAGGTNILEKLYKRLGTVQWLHLRDYAAAAVSERWLAQHMVKAEESERAAFAEAVAWYLAEDYTQALDTLTLARETASVATLDQLLVTEALVRFRSGDLDMAADLLDQRINNPQPTSILAHLKALRAYLDFARLDTTAAVSRYMEVVREFPDDRVSRPLKYFLGSMRRDTPANSTPNEPSAKAPNIVVVSVDTVRADHLSCLGYPRPITPNMDELAKRGALFERAYSTSSWTKPAHASLFTGLYPQVHGAMGHDEALLNEFPTLPELLRDQGYATMGVISAPPLHRMFGFARGFQHYDDQTYLLDRQANLFLRADGASQVDIHSGSTSTLITDAALRMLESQRQNQRPFFLFVNYFDAHHNYLPPAALVREWCEPYAGTQYGVIDSWNESPEPISVSPEMLDVDRLRALYAAEVNHVDAQVGRLVEYLKENALLENTIVIVFSDHGEEFLEHGRLAHGRSLYEEVVRVPLIFAGPGIPKGQRVRTPVSLVDVMPTTLSLSSAPIPQSAQGRVLIERNSISNFNSREIFAWLNLPPFHFHAIVNEGAKMIRDMADGRRVLHDLLQDPSESHDKLAIYPELGRQLNEALERFLVDSAHRRSLHIGSKETRVDAAPESIEEMEAQLRALGYVAD